MCYNRHILSIWCVAMKKTTYTKITAKIIIVTLSLTLISAFFYGEYMKNRTVSNLASVEAKKTSMLVFESLYSAMQKGWNKEDLEEIIGRLNEVDSNMKIDVYRSAFVSELYGEIQKDKIARENNDYIKTAMGGTERLIFDKPDFIKYFYPVVAKNDCLECHVNAQSGDVLGVINVSYPISDLKVSLAEMINFFMLFFIFFSMVIFIAIFLKFDKYLIKPIKKFSSLINTIASSKDITKRVSLEDNIEEIDSIKMTFNKMLDSIEYQFYNDSLTGLQNRRRLIENLAKDDYGFLMVVNIDGFQEINDLYGEESGDEVLREFAKFLQKLAHKEDILYRLHTDEFAYLCKRKIDLNDFINLVTQISEKIAKKSFNINNNTEVSLTATMGVAYGFDMLLANADIALKIAKKNRKNFLVYDSSMQMEKEYEKNFEWTKKLKDAINEDRIVPVFQPIVDTQTQEVVKYEALVRMKDSSAKLISPIHFLDLAKKNKLYHQLTKIMIQKSFAKFRHSNCIVSINISVDDILNEEVYNFIIQKLQEYGIGERVAFEIIESDGIENFEAVLRFIEKVKTYGVRISIDDFGTGYSNFEYLMKLKVDYIKIDGSMIKNLYDDENAQKITQTIVRFAKEIGIKTVAEFVCSKNIYDKVAQMEVDLSQGYYFGEPKEEIESIECG